MLSVYDEKLRWTQEADKLSIEFKKATERLIDCAFERGFSPEAVWYICSTQINEQVLMYILGERYKGEKNDTAEGNTCTTP